MMRFLFGSLVAVQITVLSTLAGDIAHRPVAMKTGDARVAITVLRADDPYPCPGCDDLPDPGLKLASLRADDPYPCPGCDDLPDPGLKLALAAIRFLS